MILITSSNVNRIVKMVFNTYSLWWNSVVLSLRGELKARSTLFARIKIKMKFSKYLLKLKPDILS